MAMGETADAAHLTATSPAPLATDHKNLPLFRSEVLDAQSELRFGRPVGLLPLSWTLLTGFLLFIVAVTMLFLATASYARKETATGLLRPVSGDLRINARAAGIVQTLPIHEGQIVEQGALLAVISTSRTLESGAVADDQILAGLSQEEEALRARLAAQDAAAPFDDRAFAAQIASLVAQRDAARAEIGADTERLRIAQERLESGRLLDARGFIARDELRRREEAVITQTQAITDARAHVASFAAQIAELTARRQQKPQLALADRAQLAEDLAGVVQRRAQYEAERGFAVRAPIRGRVSALQAALGQDVDPQRPLMTLTAPEAKLYAELYVPSRAIGFVTTGQEVRILYDAFSYQRFGPASGRVQAISATVLGPQEILSAAELREPVYRVIVALDRQSMRAFGRNTPLQAGMALTADIVLEKRSFLEWLFEPLLAMRGRI